MKFINDNKGAVTIFVTILLIPSIIVSGMAVDLSRIYTMQSIFQDANQLAANALLTQYQEMLQDVYGLYGIMEEDPILGKLLDEYIQVSILGEDWQDSSIFKLFEGSGLTSKTTFNKDKSLRNPEVVRRQIEEYVKYRAPVIIIDEIWDRIDSFKKIKADSEVIETKMKIDEGIEEIDKLYKEIYSLISSTAKIPNDIFDNINGSLAKVKRVLDEMSEADMYYEIHMKDENNKNEEWGEVFRQTYQAQLDNLKILATGGKFGIGWLPRHQEDGEWIDGKFENEIIEEGIESQIKKQKSRLNDYINNVKKIQDLCVKVDGEKQRLKGLVNKLELDVKGNKCSKELSNGIKGVGSDNPNLIAEYKRLLKFSLSPMGDAMFDYNNEIAKYYLDTLENIYYGEIRNNIPPSKDPRLSVEDMKNPPSYIDMGSLDMRVKGGDDYLFMDLWLGQLCDISNERLKYIYTLQFKKFQDSSFNNGKNAKFYKVLVDRYSKKAENDEKNKREKNILTALSDAQDDFTNIIAGFIPEGAKFYMDKSTYDKTFNPDLLQRIGNGVEGVRKFVVGGVENLGKSYFDTVKKHTKFWLDLANIDNDLGNTEFDENSDWGDKGRARSDVKGFLNGGIPQMIGDGLNAAGNKILLLTYDSEMFSDISTGKIDEKDENGNNVKKVELTMTGEELSTANNYFYQSELEYLYAGHSNAIANIGSVSSLLLLVRFVFNYISTFIIPEIGVELTAISAPAGIFAPIVRELARLGYALGESVIDVGNLVNGKPVPIMKTKLLQWKFSIGGLGGSIIKDKMNETSGQKIEDHSPKMFYKDYLRLFLLLVGSDDLADRTVDLIELNLTNRKDNINANEKAMASATLYDMSKVQTSFTITTSADMKMLFLSQSFVQKNIGVRPPKTYHISVTDCRGY